jgi:hypothetical protein
VVEAVVRAYGTPAQLGRLEGYRAEGLVTDVTTRTVGELVRYVEPPGRLRIELRFPDRGEVRILRDGLSWAGTDDRSLDSVGVAPEASLVLEAGWPSLPLDLAALTDSLEFMEEGGDDRIVLRLPLGGGLLFDRHIHPKDHRIVRLALWAGDGKKPIYRKDLSGFRWIRGVLFPFKEVVYENGKRTQEVRFRDVDLNPNVPEVLFHPAALN